MNPDSLLPVRDFWLLARGKRTYLNLAIERYFCRGESIAEIAQDTGVKPHILHKKANRIRHTLELCSETLAKQSPRSSIG